MKQVTHVRKDIYGDITAIGSYGWEHSLATAITNIEGRWESYFVRVNGLTANVVVAWNGNRKYLKTDADSTTRNNLDSLPLL